MSADRAAKQQALMPRMLHHSGFVTHDAEKTVDFYSRILGMEFCATVMDDRVPSTGEDFPYLHLFFRMGDGSTLAFFECPSMPLPSKPSHPAYDVFNHVALAAASKAEIDRWAAHLRANGVEVLGPVDHGIIYSIYFHDPNGIRLEFTTTVDDGWMAHPDAARKDVADWAATKREAEAAGKDSIASLLTLIRAKKAEMKARGIIGADELHGKQ